MANEILTEIEARIIGSLIEKEFTTPDYYPMTVNSLMNACNQKSNREPVVSYDEAVIDNNLEELRDKKFVCRVTGGDMRVPKFKQIFTLAYNFTKAEIAVICILFLRGPQTIGEIRGRTGRIYDFKDLAETDEVILNLINRAEPLVVKLPRLQGKEAPRYAHLFCGEVKREDEPVQTETDKERILKLEKLVEELSNEIAEIKNRFSEFKKQFE